jgi:deazaflavin-dependent oxidoreductase (nitroreductase family)
MSTSSEKFNRQIIEEFRANHGRVGGTFAGTPLLLLRHIGAKSQKTRVSPLGFCTDGGAYIVCASNGGAGRNPDWYFNLMAQPDVTIEVGVETIPVHAREASGEERDHLFAAFVARAPQLVEYAERAGRTIPVLVLARAEHT